MGGSSSSGGPREEPRACPGSTGRWLEISASPALGRSGHHADLGVWVPQGVRKALRGWCRCWDVQLGAQRRVLGDLKPGPEGVASWSSG